MDLLESIFPLRIFPADSLAASVTTTVWVGVWVVAYFNLRLGWVASGLVVPGYLVPLLLVRPWTVFAIYVESAVTFGVVYVLSESFHTRKPWSSFFGRDRFFALVLVSILVRAVFDGWLFPQFGAWINSTFAIHFDYHSNLHSFGLIIVSRRTVNQRLGRTSKNLSAKTINNVSQSALTGNKSVPIRDIPSRSIFSTPRLNRRKSCFMGRPKNSSSRFVPADCRRDRGTMCICMKTRRWRFRWDNGAASRCC